MNQMRLVGKEIRINPAVHRDDAARTRPIARISRSLKPLDFFAFGSKPGRAKLTIVNCGPASAWCKAT